MNMKRIVLAGGSGFIGRALAKALLVRGYEVVVLTRTPRKRHRLPGSGMGRRASSANG